MFKKITSLVLAFSLYYLLYLNCIHSQISKCPDKCEFGLNFFNDNNTWTCKCAKDICEELECAKNSTCKIKYSQKCVDNTCTRSKTVYCQSNKKDGLCPATHVNRNLTKTCLQDVDCPDYDKCCPSSNGIFSCTKPCFKPKCSCKPNYINEYTTNSKGCPMCHCVKRKIDKSKLCSLPKEVGPCRAAHTRYFYNNVSKQCERFTYGGCHGNENNFLSINECESTCMSTKMIQRNETNKCLLDKETGPCKAAFLRYYYDSNKKSCEVFTYGGCKGNKNNFESKESCERDCVDSLKPKDTVLNKCFMNKEVGPCFASLSRYYFNKVTKKCEEFFYGGCQGNENNFETLEECSKECSIHARSTKINKCELNPDGGFCRGYMERFFYNKNSGKCEMFVYGGCGGNDNNFVHIDGCIKECAQNVVLEQVENKSTQSQSICELDKEIGPCKAYFEKYYFNKKTKSCEKFGWGGCKGNANKFNSLEECQRECPIEKFEKNSNDMINKTDTISDNSYQIGIKVSDKLASDICQLKKETGNCKAFFPRFYFNSSTNKCENFVWGGCGGNENNFSSEEECYSICGKQEVNKTASVEP